MFARLRKRTWRKARKAHYCGGCAETISPSELYADEAFVFDREAYTWRLCANCEPWEKVALFFHDQYNDEAAYEPGNMIGAFHDWTYHDSGPNAGWWFFEKKDAEKATAKLMDVTP